MKIQYPSDADEVAAIISEGRSLEIVGLGSKRALGQSVAADAILSTEKLCGVEFYEPDEMVMALQSGTPLAMITRLLDAAGQRLSFDPPDWRDWLSPQTPDQTIGGIVAANLAGSLRLNNGAPRDHLLGFSAVNGRGEVFKSGGRVVKNVTGYDLPKLMAGSFGTLGVMTRMTLRTLPKPEFETTLVIASMSAGSSIRLFASALGGPWEIASAAWLPASLSPGLGLEGDVALLRIEGFEVPVRERCNSLRESHSLAAELLEGDASRLLWQALSNGGPLGDSGDSAIWRISVPPASGAQLLDSLPGNTGWMDWAGGLLWLAMPDEEDAGASRIRQRIRQCGGHATLLKASASTRARVPVFEPQPATLAALSSRIKAAFDPHNLLNPGRMG